MKVTPRFPGVIRSMVKRLGDKVRKDEVLATVESNQSLTTYDVQGADRRHGDRPRRHAGRIRVRAEGAVHDRRSVQHVDRLRRLSPRFLPRAGGRRRLHRRRGRRRADRGADRLRLAARRQRHASVRGPRRRPQRAAGCSRACSSPAGSCCRPRRPSRHPGRRGAGPRTARPSSSCATARPSPPARSSWASRDADWIEVRSGMIAGDVYAARNSFVLKAELGKGSAGA